MSKTADLIAMLRGLESVTRALIAHQQRETSRVWSNSSLRNSYQGLSNKVEERISDVIIGQEAAMVNIF